MFRTVIYLVCPHYRATQNNTLEFVLRRFLSSIKVGQADERLDVDTQACLLHNLPVERLLEAFTLVHASGNTLPYPGTEVALGRALQ
jgi:hypothetical protein